MNRFTPTERLGVNQVEKIFLDDFGWIPRQVFQSDVGIDMEVEICDNGKPTGQLIGVQIKSGESYFKKDIVGDIIYRGSTTHLDYWLNHSLPIIIVLHNPTDGQTVWQKIEEKKITVSNKGWKTEIPSTQLLNKDSKKEIERLNKYPLYFQRLQRLAVHKELIIEIESGEKIVVEVEEWINKTIGKASIKVKKVVDECDEVLLSEGAYIYFKGVKDLNVLYPWAEFQIDKEYYEEDDEDNFMSEHGIWDSENKEYLGTTIDYHEYKGDLPKIRPIESGSGEIHFYRLEFSLNSLGKSFLEVNNFLEFGKQLKLDL